MKSQKSHLIACKVDGCEWLGKDHTTLVEHIQTDHMSRRKPQKSTNKDDDELSVESLIGIKDKLKDELIQQTSSTVNTFLDWNLRERIRSTLSEVRRHAFEFLGAGLTTELDTYLNEIRDVTNLSKATFLDQQPVKSYDELCETSENTSTRESVKDGCRNEPWSKTLIGAKRSISSKKPYYVKKNCVALENRPHSNNPMNPNFSRPKEISTQSLPLDELFKVKKEVEEESIEKSQTSMDLLNQMLNAQVKQENCDDIEAGSSRETSSVDTLQKEKQNSSTSFQRRKVKSEDLMVKYGFDCATEKRCAVCFQTSEDEGKLWIKCELCEWWAHKTCSSLSIKCLASRGIPEYTINSRAEYIINSSEIKEEISSTTEKDEADEKVVSNKPTIKADHHAALGRLFHVDKVVQKILTQPEKPKRILRINTRKIEKIASSPKSTVTSTTETFSKKNGANCLTHPEIHDWQNLTKVQLLIGAQPICPICTKPCQANSKLKEHIKNVHKLAVELNTVGDIVCESCGRRFSGQISLRRHVRNKHSENAQGRTDGDDFSCFACPKAFPCRRLLMAHLKNEHSELKIHVFSQEFESFDEFLLFKKELESSQGSTFVKASNTITRGLRYINYSCVRDITNKISRWKSLLTKDANCCTAFLKVRINVDGKVETQICTDHNGHDELLETGPIYGSYRQKIVEYLKDGLSIKEILLKCREFGIPLYHATEEKIEEIQKKMYLQSGTKRRKEEEEEDVDLNQEEEEEDFDLNQEEEEEDVDLNQEEQEEDVDLNQEEEEYVVLNQEEDVDEIFEKKMSSVDGEIDSISGPRSQELANSPKSNDCLEKFEDIDAQKADHHAALGRLFHVDKVVRKLLTQPEKPKRILRIKTRKIEKIASNPKKIHDWRNLTKVQLLVGAPPICPICTKPIQTNAKLKIHIKNVHKLAVELNTVGDIACESCGRRFSRQTSLRRHVRKKHPEKAQGLIRDETDFSCFACPKAFPSRRFLMEHLKNEHSELKIHVFSKEFESFDEFLLFKKELESSQGSTFVKACHCNTRGVRYITYSCIRDITNKLSRWKSLLTKDANCCTAFLKVRINVDGKVKTELCTDHNGHEELLKTGPIYGRYRQDVDLNQEEEEDFDLNQEEEEEDVDLNQEEEDFDLIQEEEEYVFLKQEENVDEIFEKKMSSVDGEIDSTSDPTSQELANSPKSNDCLEKFEDIDALLKQLREEALNACTSGDSLTLDQVLSKLKNVSSMNEEMASEQRSGSSFVGVETNVELKNSPQRKNPSRIKVTEKGRKPFGVNE
ncbi:unnamed protein product, partial [Mesorhabditis belari]|uniref:C2H2-type domain-containing protein n=1 Tax=Mesorhabditis belari TaxID=2138241 RepID=A0AAF3EK71_9BILA